MSREDIQKFSLRHRASHELVFDSKQRLFLQKTVRDKRLLAWIMGFLGGRPSVHQGKPMRNVLIENDPKNSVIRKDVPLKRLLDLQACVDTRWEFFGCEDDGPFTLDASEIDQGDWFPLSHIDTWISARPQELTGTLRGVLQLIHAIYK